MALKLEIDKLEDVEESLRPHYVAENGKFYLATQGDHPKVKEFRETNIKLTKRLAEFDGFAPAVVKADKAKLTEYEAAKPNERIAELEARLATAQASANASTLKDAVTRAFIRAGGRADAADFIVGKAADKLTVENGVVVGKGFHPDKPGVKLDVDSFIAMQVQEAGFAFHPSQGGGANPRPGGGPSSGVKELLDPTPQQLGEHAADIKAGKLKVVYSNS